MRMGLSYLQVFQMPRALSSGENGFSMGFGAPVPVAWKAAVR